MVFTVGNSARKTLGKCSDRALGKTLVNVQKNKLYNSVFVEQENNRQTSCFMAFTVSYSVGKRLENAAFARTGKL